MAEQVEFELSVLFGESGANTNRLIWPIRNSNSRYGSRKFCRWLERIKSESEPPDLATEKNTGCSVYQAPNTASPVRMRERPTAKTPRNRANFSDCSRLCARSLCDSRLGGGESGIRTHGTLRYTRFPSVRLKPLGHLSGSFRCSFILRRQHPAAELEDLDHALRSWRRGRDSNPRWVSPHTPLAGERLQPLGHLSGQQQDNGL